ncbi:unnamed protein product, partial [Polarella glacialis]
LLITMMMEHVRSGGAGRMLTHLGVEALNRFARNKSSTAAVDEIARYGGRELLDEVEANWSQDQMISLHSLNLRRRLRASKVKSLIPKKEVVLPPDDIVRIRGCFEAIDEDGSGEISEEELSVAFQMMGMKLNKDELRKEFREVDVDQSGSVEWPEFLQLMAKFGAGENLENNFTNERLAELREVFSLFDDDGNGSLDAAELTVVMRTVGLTPSKQEVHNMIDELDANGSGFIEWPEFLFLMSKQVIKPEQQHQFAFEFFDRAREGQIQKADFIKQMLLLSKDFTAEELVEMFEEAKFEN